MITANVFHWFGYWTGIANESGKGYGFWSGIGSCLTYLAALSLAYRKLNCHTAGCPWLAHHKVEGTPYVICKRHLKNLHEMNGNQNMPSKRPTIKEIHAVYKDPIKR